jgi:hypothetical protein
MNNILTQASNEWASRPADQRFANLQALFLATLKHAYGSDTANVNIRDLRVDANNNHLTLLTPKGVKGFSHWSFGQFAQRVGAPASYLRTLSPSTVATALNEGLRNTDAEQVQMYFEKEERQRALALTTPNFEVVKSLIQLPGNWRTAPARPVHGGMPGTRIATPDDVGPWSRVSVGEPIIDAGLYASDEEMFAFLIDPNHVVDDGNGGLYRGFFVRNSEVGKATFEIVRFLFQQVCGNHIVWGASEIESVAIRHLGKSARVRAFDQLGDELQKYAESSVSEEESALERAREVELGETREKLIDNLYQRKDLALSKRIITDAYESAVENESVHHASPRSAWGFVQGLTRISQDSPWADERSRLDRAAGKILSVATETKPVEPVKMDMETLAAAN